MREPIPVDSFRPAATVGVSRDVAARSWPRVLATYAAWILLAELAGAAGSFATAPAIPEWYATLAKPSWTPPGWVFGPVWKLLYAAMGVAAARVFLRHRDSVPGLASLAFFAAHLVVNAAWSFLFFGLRSPGAALAEIVLLWVMIVVLVRWWWRLDRPAALLLLPYLAWVTFAVALNNAIFQLN